MKNEDAKGIGQKLVNIGIISFLMWENSNKEIVASIRGAVEDYMAGVQLEQQECPSCKERERILSQLPEDITKVRKGQVSLTSHYRYECAQYELGRYYEIVRGLGWNEECNEPPWSFLADKLAHLHLLTHNQEQALLNRGTQLAKVQRALHDALKIARVIHDPEGV